MAKPLQRLPTDLYAFGNASRPRPPRIQGHNLKPGQLADIIPNAAGLVGPDTAGGASLFGDAARAPIRGHYHVVPAETELPEGLDVVADGVEVGGSHAPTHHTLAPAQPMSPQAFEDLFNGLPWRYGGKT